MLKPLGGRGKKAPYETVQMRVPIPIKHQLEQLVAEYRLSVLGGDDTVQLASKLEYEYCVKLVDRFIDERGLFNSLTSPRSQNLVRFRDWLLSEISAP